MCQPGKQVPFDVAHRRRQDPLAVELPLPSRASARDRAHALTWLAARQAPGHEDIAWRVRRVARSPCQLYEKRLEHLMRMSEQELPLPATNGSFALRASRSPTPRWSRKTAESPSSCTRWGACGVRRRPDSPPRHAHLWQLGTHRGERTASIWIYVLCLAAGPAELTRPGEFDAEFRRQGLPPLGAGGAGREPGQEQESSE